MTREQEINLPFTKPELSIKECRQILSRHGEQYTDEEIKEIRNFILHITDVDFRYFQLNRKSETETTKIIDISTTRNDEVRKTG